MLYYKSGKGIITERYHITSNLMSQENARKHSITQSLELGRDKTWSRDGTWFATLSRSI
jgi:hypothetical protein